MSSFHDFWTCFHHSLFFLNQLEECSTIEYNRTVVDYEFITGSHWYRTFNLYGKGQPLELLLRQGQYNLKLATGQM